MNYTIEIIGTDGQVHEPRNNYSRNMSTDSINQCSEYLEHDLMEINHSKLSDSNELKLVTSSYSHEVSYVEVVDIFNEHTKPALQSVRNFVTGLIWISLTIFGCALIGPLVMTIPAKNPYISAAWRTQGSLLFTIPMTIFIYRKNKDISFRADIQPDKLLRSFLTSIFMITWLMGLILGCSKTITSHAHVLYSSTGVYVLIFSVITWRIVHKFEIFGYMLLATGILMALSDPSAMKTGLTNQPALGNMIAFSSAGAGAVYGILNQKNSKLFHPIILMTHLFTFIVFIQLLVFPQFQDNPKFFSFDPEYGAFGWMNNLKSFWYIEIVIVPITGILGNLALLKSYEYWPLEIVSIALLWEPFVSESVAVLLGQDHLPGLQTFIGIFIISFGLFMASYGAKLKATNEIARLHAEIKIEESEMSKIYKV